MRTSAWLMGATLLFWGWENGLLIWAVLMAGILEGSRFTRLRWEFSDTDLNRIFDLCWALFFGAGLVLYSTEDRLVFVFKFAQWLPFCFFPIMAAQTYGNRLTMPLSVFSPLLRRSPNSPTARRSYNVSYPYFAFCLMAASASTRPNAFFYSGVTLLVVLALAGTRPRRISFPAWLGLAAAVATIGFFSHQELRRLQNSLEGALGSWIAEFFRTAPDSKECRTGIGHSGRITLSGKIVLRLRPSPGSLAPSLLSQASWDSYKNQTWFATSNDFSLVTAGTADKVRLLPAKPISSEVEIAGYFENGEGTLALPRGTFELDDVSAVVRTNRLGVTSVDGGPGMIDMRATFGPGASLTSPPAMMDHLVPDTERPVIAGIIKQLNLTNMTDRQKVHAIVRYFGKPFTYTLDIPDFGRPRNSSMTPLGYFLTRTHAGHCEYFATATVLLLRQAGLSARYVTGYAVLESARSGDTYLVRMRHAHAWAEVFHKDTGLWEQIDTTPAKWDLAEGAAPPWWEPISDAGSNLFFQFSKWRWSKTSYARYTSWMLVPLILYLAWRIITNQRRQPPILLPPPVDLPEWPGRDSELYLINQQLTAMELSRLPNESLARWQERVEAVFPNSERLQRIFQLHRSLRFDPHGLKKADRETLRMEAQEWLAQFALRAPKGGEPAA